MRRSLLLLAALARSSSSPAAAARAPARRAAARSTSCCGTATSTSRARRSTAAAKRFNATHPKIHVTVQNYGNADYALQKVLTAIRGGSYPDIVYLYGSWAANMARTPKAVDLAPLIKADPSINWNDFWPAERQAVTVGPKIVGVPALVDNLALVYNKKLFDQAGLAYPTADWTWDDFRAAAKQPDGSVGEAVRLGLRERRERGHGVAVRRAAVAGRRRHPDARPEARGVQLAGRRRRPPPCSSRWRPSTTRSTSTTATATTPTSSTRARSACSSPGHGTSPGSRTSTTASRSSPATRTTRRSRAPTSG